MMRKTVDRVATLGTAAALVILILAGSACAAPIIWSGGGDKTDWDDSKNWTGGKVPGDGSDVSLPDNALLPRHDLTMNLIKTYHDIRMVGNISYILNLTQNLGVSGALGSDGGAALAITGNKDVVAENGFSLVGIVDMNLTSGKKLKLGNALNGVGGGGLLNLRASNLIEAKVNNDSTNRMDFAVSLAQGVTAGLDNKKNVVGGAANGLVHWTDVRLGNASTLQVKADRQADVRLDLTLLGSSATLDIEAKEELGRSSTVFLGDLITTAATTMLTIDILRSDNNVSSGTFVGKVSPGASDIGTLNIDPTNGSDEVIFEGTATYVWELGAAADVINVLGDLTIVNGFNLELNILSGALGGTYNLFTYTGEFHGDTNAWNVTNPDRRIDGKLTITDTGSAIEIAVVMPEPATMGLLGLGLVWLVVRRKR